MNSRDATERVLNERLALIQCLHQSTLPLQIWPFIWTLSKSKNHGRESRAHQRMITTYNSYGTLPTILCLSWKGEKSKRVEKERGIDLARWLFWSSVLLQLAVSTISHEIYSIAKSSSVFFFFSFCHHGRILTKEEKTRLIADSCLPHHILICFCAWVADAVLFVVFKYISFLVGLTLMSTQVGCSVVIGGRSLLSSTKILRWPGLRTSHDQIPR